MSIVAHVTLRATRADPEASPLAEITVVCEEIAATLAAAGWKFEVVEAREAGCVAADPYAHLDGIPVGLGARLCPDAATEVVDGAELCARHAASGALRRAS